MDDKLDKEYLVTAVGIMERGGVGFVDGLSDAQILAAEQQHGIRFPPDLRSFLSYRLPIGEGFPDWRRPSSTSIANQFSSPLDGILFDITKNGFWYHGWGSRPESEQQAVEIAKERIQTAPVLIPVFRHRYMPDRPRLPGNPVFSVHQTDVIYYGFNLMSYLSREFGVEGSPTPPEAPRGIEFWSELEQLD